MERCLIDAAPASWARRYPSEQVWKVRRRRSGFDENILHCVLDESFPSHRQRAIEFLCGKHPDLAAARDEGDLYFALFDRLGEEELAIRSFVRNVIRDTADGRMNWTHLCIGELVRMRLVHTVFTTNFDDLLARGMAAAGEFPAVIDDIEALKRMESVPPVPQLIHLHGSQHAYRPRNTVHDLAGFELEAAAKRLTDLLAESRVLIVIGYNGSSRERVVDMLRAALDALPDPIDVFWIAYGEAPSAIAADLLNGDDVHRKLVPRWDSDLFFAELLTALGQPEPMCVARPATLEVARAFRLRTGLLPVASRGGPPNPTELAIFNAHIRLRDRAQRAEHFWPSDPVAIEPLPDGREAWAELLSQIDRISPVLRTSYHWQVRSRLNQYLGDYAWEGYCKLVTFAKILQLPGPPPRLPVDEDAELLAWRYWTGAIEDCMRFILSVETNARYVAPELYTACIRIHHCSRMLYMSGLPTPDRQRLVSDATNVLASTTERLPTNRYQAWGAFSLFIALAKLAALQVRNAARQRGASRDFLDEGLSALLCLADRAIHRAEALLDGHREDWERALDHMSEQIYLAKQALQALRHWNIGDQAVLIDFKSALAAHALPFGERDADYENAMLELSDIRADVEIALSHVGPI